MNALKGGTWVQRGAVKVWTAASEPPPKIYDLSKLIACPTCRAKVTETCRTKNGRRTTPHGSRLAPRLCICGALLGNKRRLCDDCRDESIRLSKRDHLRRLRGGLHAARPAVLPICRSVESAPEISESPSLSWRSATGTQTD